MGPPEFYTELCQKSPNILQLSYRNLQYRNMKATEDSKQEISMVHQSLCLVVGLFFWLQHLLIAYAYWYLL